MQTKKLSATRKPFVLTKSGMYIVRVHLRPEIFERLESKRGETVHSKFIARIVERSLNSNTDDPIKRVKQSNRSARNANLITATRNLIETHAAELKKIPNPRNCKNGKTGIVYNWYESAKYFVKRFGDKRLEALYNSISTHFNQPKYQRGNE